MDALPYAVGAENFFDPITYTRLKDIDGYTDLENMLFDWCKENNEEWLCKVSYDIIFQECILDKEVEEADFYYLNGIGYGGMVKYNFDFGNL